MVLLIATSISIIDASENHAKTNHEKLKINTTLTNEKLEKSKKEINTLSADASLYTDKFLYLLGEDVAITFHNTDNTAVALDNGEPMFEIWRFIF